MTDQLHVQLSVNLAGLQGMALDKLQRVIDVLTFARVGAGRVDAEGYASQMEFFALHPAEDRRLAFEDARSATEEWFTLHVIRDAIDITGAFLEEARLCCGIFELTKRHNPTLKDLEVAQAEGRRFHSLGLPMKLERLNERYGVDSGFSEHILSMNRARNCLVHRLGKVTGIDADDSGELVVSWVELQLQVAELDGPTRRISEPTEIEGGATLNLLTVPVSRTFKLGEQLAFSYTELIGQLFSLVQFVNSYAQSVQEFAEGLGHTFAPRQPAP